MSLSTKIILFLGTMMLLFFGTSIYYLNYTVRQSFKDEVTGNLASLAEVNKNVYFGFVAGLKIRTLDLSSGGRVVDLAEKILDKKKSPQERQASAKEFGAYIREYKMPNAKDVLIVDMLDADGVVIASTREDRIGVNERKEEIDFNAHHFSSAIGGLVGQAWVKTSVFEPDESDKSISHVTARMFSREKDDQGNLIPLPAVLLVHFVSLSALADFWQQASSTASGGGFSEKKLTGLQSLDVYLVNGDRKIVSVPRSGTQILLGKPIESKPVAACFERESGMVGEYVNYQGVSVLGFATCMFDDGILILNEVQTSNAYGFLDSLVTRTIFGGGLIFVLLLVSVFLMNRRFLKSLSLIVESAKAVTQGNFTQQVPVSGRDEVGYLSNVFNTMLQTISTSQEKMKQSEKKLEDEAKEMSRDLKEHEEQSAFIEKSKRATQNLLEDAWDTKEKIEVERNRFQIILSSIGDALVLIDGHYIITLVNPKTVDLFAMPVTELLGKDLRVVMKLIKKKKGELSPGEWPIEEMFLTKHIVIADMADELSLATEKRTTPVPVALSVAPFGGEGGATSGGVIVIRDVTEDRELDEAKSGFISVASHQLRTPLTTIRWYSEMLLADDAGTLTKDQREFLSEIHGGAERLYQTIDLLLGISRVESGKLKGESKSIDLSLFTADLGKELAPQMLEKKLVFSATPPSADSVFVSLDPLTLRQVVLNLISNAIRYTNENGTIEAKWVINDAHTEVTYSVKDDGIGIPLAQRGRIFSKFFRAENALSKVPDGSGLGLVLVKELVLAWGGKVWFEVEDGKGTTFFFIIPLVTIPPPLAEEPVHGKI